jgi:hypothetical protein
MMRLKLQVMFNALEESHKQVICPIFKRWAAVTAILSRFHVLRARATTKLQYNSLLYAFEGWLQYRFERQHLRHWVCFFLMFFVVTSFVCSLGKH